MRRTRLPVRSLKAWADLNGVELNGVVVKDLKNGRGAGLIATRDTDEENNVFVRVPRELVLSKDLVWDYARSDPSLRLVLEAMGEWAKTAQGAIILFLLIQVTASSPDVTDRVCLPNPFTDYVKFLPDEKGLPSRWSEHEVECLWGTSLRNHMAAKQHSLETIFNDLRTRTQSIPWCAKWWWDEDTGILTLDDFKEVDSMFRSRAMDFGDQGQCLVPVMDMANHDHAEHNVALFEIDRTDNSALLVLQDYRYVRRGYEVTINYGSDRSASDLLHAYGFIEDMPHAGSMFVSFPAGFPPFQGDPLATAKYVGLELVPGVKFYVSSDGRVKFHSPFVYAMSVNEEDGLSWDVAQTVHGEKEFQFLFQGAPVNTADELVKRMQEHVLWDLFQWRAHAYLSILLESLVRDINDLEARSLEEKLPNGITTRNHAWRVAVKLRRLEGTLLKIVQEDFKSRLEHLQNSETVILWSKGELGSDGVLASAEAMLTIPFKIGKHVDEEDSGIKNGADYDPTQEQSAAAEEEWNSEQEQTKSERSTKRGSSSLNHQSGTNDSIEPAMSSLSISDQSGISGNQANLLSTRNNNPSKFDSSAFIEDHHGEILSSPSSSAGDSKITHDVTPTNRLSSPVRIFSSLDGHISPPQLLLPIDTAGGPLSGKKVDLGPLRYLGRMRFDRADRQRREAAQLAAETHRAVDAVNPHGKEDDIEAGSEELLEDFS